MIFRKELEKKAEQISKETGITMSVNTGNRKVNIITPNRGLYSGDITDCYNYLEGFMGAIKILKEVDGNVSY